MRLVKQFFEVAFRTTALTMPPAAALSALKNFAGKGYELKHRYGLVPHIDERHPHVHCAKVLEKESRQAAGAGSWSANFGHVDIRHAKLPSADPEEIAAGKDPHQEIYFCVCGAPGTRDARREAQKAPLRPAPNDRERCRAAGVN